MLCSGFFFQAEDGIRAGHVTGVQTCALPIYQLVQVLLARRLHGLLSKCLSLFFSQRQGRFDKLFSARFQPRQQRSEERRVGKECRSRRETYQQKKKEKGMSV